MYDGKGNILSKEINKKHWVNSKRKVILKLTFKLTIQRNHKFLKVFFINTNKLMSNDADTESYVIWVLVNQQKYLF
jgi:hypothetical protein